MELLYPATCLLLLLLLLTRPGVTSGDNSGLVKVVVKEGSDTVLPCSLDQKDLTHQTFDWTKDGQKEVFLHETVSTDPNKRQGQDPQFKGRVSRFESELRNGNASIKISNTKVEDSGNYSCIFPNLQTFDIKLIVGASPEPYVRKLDHTADRALLECIVKGSFPKPTVEWKDSAGKVLHSVVTNETEVDKRFYITLQTYVTQTGHYNCVVTQYEIHHQVYFETFERIGPDSQPGPDSQSGVSVGTVVLIVGVLLIVAAGFISCLCIKIRKLQHSLQERNYGRPPPSELNSLRQTESS